MKAILQQSYGSDYTTVLAMSDTTPLPNPNPKKHEVRIYVSFSALNPIDVKFAKGDYAEVLKHKFPCPVARDFSGVIDNVPDGITNPKGFKVGDRVCGFLDHLHLDRGSMAQYVCCPVRILAKVPDKVSLRAAAGLPLVGLTTYVGLIENLKLTRGCQKSILILGGSSATGMLAIQLSRVYGCKAVITTSTNADLCTSLGATRVIDYRKEHWWEVLRGAEVDYVFDCIGGPASYEGSKAVLSKKGGMFYTIVGDHTEGKITTGKMLGFMCSIMCRGCCSHAKYKMGMNLPSDADRGLTFWLDLAASGEITLVQDPTSVTSYPFTLEGATAMYTLQGSGRAKGKLIMSISGVE